MKDVNSILEQLDKGRDVREIRRAITDLIVKLLTEARQSLGYWEKANYANAIAALAWNINSSHQQPSPFWLRLCLVNLEKALVPVEQRDENYTPRDKQLESLTFEELIEAVEAVRKSG